MQRISNTSTRCSTSQDAAQTRAPTKSKAEPTKNNATSAAKKTHAAREAQDMLLATTIHHNGKHRLELCGYFTHDPVSKKHTIPMKGCDVQTRADVGNACNELVLKGGATKATIIELKLKMIAGLAKTQLVCVCLVL